MKWFKHISDSLDDPFIFDLLNRYGADGYLVFFGILEIYSREFKAEPGWNLSVTRSYLKQKLCKRQDTLIINCLKHITNSGKWIVEFNEDQVTIFIPKFHEMVDEFTKRKLGTKSGQAPKKLHTEAEREVEVEKEEKKEEPQDGLSELVDRVRSAFPKFKVFPFIAIHKKDNRQALIHTLNRLMEYHANGIPIKDPYPFCEKIIQNENGKYNARDHDKKAQEYKITKGEAQSFKEIFHAKIKGE